MPFTKQIQRIAKSGDNDIQITFAVAQGGPNDGKLVATVFIATDNGLPYESEAAVLVPADMTELTAQEKLGLRDVLKKIRDAALDQAGYTQA